VLAKKSKYSVINKAALYSVRVGLLYMFAAIPIIMGLIPEIYYKIIMLITNMMLVRLYWNLSDSGWFSVPIYLVVFGLIWAVLYLIAANPNISNFSLVYNRFWDLIFFFIIGCSIYRIRYLKKRAIRDAELIAKHTQRIPSRSPQNLAS